MNKWNTMKLIIILGVLALSLTGCFDSNDDLDSTSGGMDHSQMGQSSKDSNNELSQKRTTEIDTLNGKEITLTAQTSNLEISSGEILPVWTFNNSVPGPQIRVKQGDQINITLKNELPDPVSIHWHGVPVPNAMDGIPGVTQNAVQPGQSFVYKFKADVPGTYWYHSHQDSVNQVDKGLYGAFVVESKEDNVDREYTLVLDEWVSSSSTDMDMSSMDHGTEDTTGVASEDHDMSMYDRFTINGKTGSTVEKLIVKKDEKVRIRLINAGFMSHNMHLHGHEFKVTATDGQPINNPTFVKDQLVAIAPGERYDIEFVADKPGQWTLEDHGSEAPVKGMKAMIEYDDTDAGEDKPNETAALSVLDMSRYGQAGQSKFTMDQQYDLDYTMNLGTEQRDGKQVFTINEKTYPNTEKLEVKVGDVVKVGMINNSKNDDHPMHLHGHFFQVLSKNGKPIEGSTLMKDTLNVKPGEEYMVAFEADNPGDWMFHCHDLHHATAGMVTHLMYSDFKTNFVPDPKAGNKAE